MNDYQLGKLYEVKIPGSKDYPVGRERLYSTYDPDNPGFKELGWIYDGDIFMFLGYYQPTLYDIEDKVDECLILYKDMVVVIEVRAYMALREINHDEGT